MSCSAVIAQLKSVELILIQKKIKNKIKKMYVYGAIILT